MDLFTRCPACDTTFRVTTHQLQTSSGQVRCGQCQEVFDAFATLTAQEPLPAAEEVPAPVEAIAEPVAGLQKPAPVIEATVAEASPMRPDPAADLYEWEFRMPETPRYTLLWAMIATLLAVALCAQAAYAFRTDFMVLFPGTRQFYQRFCDLSGCVIRPPRLSGYLHIEASDLNAVDAAHPGEVQFTLAVRNRAQVELAYPDVELTLTDAMERPIARKVFVPAQYLRGEPASPGIKAGGDLAFQLFLDTGSLQPAGYRVYLFYQ